MMIHGTEILLTDNLKNALRVTELESEVRSLHFIMKQVRDMLAGALCCECGDPLGHDEEIVCDDEDRTIHKHCENGNDK